MFYFGVGCVVCLILLCKFSKRSVFVSCFDINLTSLKVVLGLARLPLRWGDGELRALETVR